MPFIHVASFFLRLVNRIHNVGGEVDLDVGPEEQDLDDGEGKGATSGAGDKATAELEVNYNCSYYSRCTRSEICWCIQDKNRRQVEFLSEELLSFLHSSSGLKGLTFTMVSFTFLSTIVSRGKERVELTKARH